MINSLTPRGHPISKAKAGPQDNTFPHVSPAVCLSRKPQQRRSGHACEAGVSIGRLIWTFVSPFNNGWPYAQVFLDFWRHLKHGTVLSVETCTHTHWIEAWKCLKPFHSTGSMGSKPEYKNHQNQKPLCCFLSQWLCWSLPVALLLAEWCIFACCSNPSKFCFAIFLVWYQAFYLWRHHSKVSRTHWIWNSALFKTLFLAFL